MSCLSAAWSSQLVCNCLQYESGLITDSCLCGLVSSGTLEHFGMMPAVGLQRSARTRSDDIFRSGDTTTPNLALAVTFPVCEYTWPLHRNRESRHRFQPAQYVVHFVPAACPLRHEAVLLAP